ncbi:beta-glucosidase 17 isoform X2 [Jatropha curcas]|uniref:beta-glucosidase 17 isoform X2 n=1 Tax=Jatropha curcas TaxID=180498 RepID=UPI0009D6558C|nr:beta-glucosidase 17 isoform X2 [Jatropha curcas]
MEAEKWLLLQLVFVGYVLVRIEGLNRSSFPTGFIFGAGSSAYQYEGAAYIDGKGPSIWDTFARIHPEKILDHNNGNIAEDFYHHYKEDIALMKVLGLDSFRFSISWSRVLPKGKISGGVNQDGVHFYNNLINELLSNGIQPFVTLLHYDPPQALEDEYGGFLSPNIVDDYGDYADFCFKEFGDRVKYWVTINEPNLFSSNGYATSRGPPCRCSDYIDQNCKDFQQGKIGISVLTEWKVPKYQTSACIKAAFRAMDFQFGWIVNPITYGDYPRTMRSIVGHRLPKFTKQQSKMLKGSLDFIGVNYYTAYYAEDAAYSRNVNLSYTTDNHVNLTTKKDGIPLGQPTSYDGYYFYPKGIQELVLYIKRKYKNPVIYVTENGLLDVRNSSLSITDELKDKLRISFHHQHLSYLLKAIEDNGANVRGYFLWSFLDDFEWEFGYTIQLGINYVDFNDGLKRYSKNSALWFKKFLQKKNVTITCHSFSFLSSLM